MKIAIKLSLIVLLCGISAPPVASESIQLASEHGTYMVPVRVNDQFTLPFVLDTGATNVVIPYDVVLTLVRTGTLKTSDFIGTGIAVLADGSELPSLNFLLRELKVGDHVVKSVTASVAPAKGDPLLGQSFLAKLPAWTIDNERHALVLFDRANPARSPQRGAVAMPSASPQETPRSFTTTPNAPVGLDAGSSAGELEERATRAFAIQDFVNGTKWCRIASEKGSALGMRCIGSVYAKGLGVPVNYTEAMKWYHRAGETGDPSSMLALGVLYAEGKLVVQDFSEALYWYRMAAAQGNADAENGIGALYMNGQGVPQDYAEAMRWYRMAADRGVAPAQNNIGILYMNGQGVPQDYAEAMRWYRMAADRGVAPAQNNIGYMVARGQGVGKDCAVARQWLERAAAAGSELARSNLRSGVNGVCHWM